MSILALSALEGARLHVVQAGEGPAIVAIHGFTGDVSTWTSFSQSAANAYTLVTLDVLGHGKSDSPADLQLYDMEHTVAALKEVLDRLGMERVCWLGYSMGARIALAAALDLPERSAGLMMESGSPGLPTAEERAARVASDEALAQRIEREGVPDFVDYWQALPLWAGQARLPQAVRDGLRAQRLKNNPTGLANSLRGVGTGAQPPLHARLRELRCSVLFLAGAEDRKFAAIAGEMRHAVGSSRLAIVEEVGHCVHLEAPEAFKRLVLDFLSQVYPGDSAVATNLARSLPTP